MLNLLCTLLIRIVACLFLSVSTYLYTSMWRCSVCVRAYVCAQIMLYRTNLCLLLTYSHSHSYTWTSLLLQKHNKNVILGRCYHMFCRSCIDQNLAKRNRKCPECAVHYGQDDLHKIWLFNSNDS